MAQTRRSMNQEPEEQPDRKKPKLRTSAVRTQPSKANESAGVETGTKQEYDGEVASENSSSLQGGHTVASEAAALPTASQEPTNRAMVNTPPTATEYPDRRPRWEAVRPIRALNEKKQAVGRIMDKAYLGIRESIYENASLVAKS
jgi:hypothetical protein